MAPDGCEGELELAPALVRLMATPWLMTLGSWQGRFRDFMTLPQTPEVPVLQVACVKIAQERFRFHQMIPAKKYNLWSDDVAI